MLDRQKREATYFTDDDFHDIGIAIIRHNVVALGRQARASISRAIRRRSTCRHPNGPVGGSARFLITRRERDIAAFKTPGLRNVLVRALLTTAAGDAVGRDGPLQQGDGLQIPIGTVTTPNTLALTGSDIDDVVDVSPSLHADTGRRGSRSWPRRQPPGRTDSQRDAARAFGPKLPQPKPLRPCAGTRPNHVHSVRRPLAVDLETGDCSAVE